MQTQTAAELQKKKCLPCEGGIEACPLASAEAQVAKLPGWKLTHEGKRIRKDWTMKDFPAAIEFFGKVAEVAEADDHHPDSTFGKLSQAVDRNLDACDWWAERE